MNKKHNKTSYTPVRLIVVTTICIFVAESLIMLLLSSQPHLRTLTMILVDASLIVICTLPVLYFLFLRPLQKLIQAKTEGETKFRLLANHTNDWEYCIDPDGNYIYMSSSCEQITGYSRDEFTDNPKLLFDLIEPKYSEQISSHYDQAKNKKNPPHSTEFPIITKNGEEKWLEHHCLSVFDEQGNYIGRRGNNRDITERKKTEDLIQQSEEKYRLIFETAPYLITSVDANGTLVDCNNKILDMLGYTKKEIIGQNMGIIIHPDYHQEALDTIKDLINTGITTKKEYKMIRKNGRVIDVNISSSSIRNKDNNYIRSICIIEDITERKEAETALQKNNEYVNTVLESTADGILAIDANGNIIHTNQKFAEMWNIPHKLLDEGQDKNLLNHVLGQLVDPEAFISKVKLLYQSLEDDLDMLMFKDGRIFERYSCPLINHGILDGRVWSFRDITVRKKAEETNALLSSAIEQADETIVITNAEGIIEYVNPAFEKITGYTAKEAIGQNPKILKSGLHDETFYKNLWNTLSSGNQWQGEITNKKKDGSLYTENVTISPVFDSQGNIINYVAAKNDITETKRLQELESRAERLELAGTIAGQVAHDFNNLLAPIMAYPEFIRDELPHDNKARAYLETIEESAKKIADINQDLLTMGRRGHYNQKAININKIVLHAVKEMESRSKTITCQTDLCANLMNIKGGTAQIHRMLTNLLVNAQDAMDNIGVITIKTENYYADDTIIAFGCVPRGEYVKLTIADNGCGIPDEIIQKILDPFFSTKTANKKCGAGLGMSVVDSVMKDHNGHLDLSSTVGSGTSFYLYFPITREDSKENITEQFKGGSESILVVDDDDVQREVSTHLLNSLGYKVSAVENGEEAIKFLNKNKQDLVILDMIMSPGIDGAETYRQILENNPNQKAIIASGFSESDRVFEAQKLGVGAFVKKPFTKATIAAAVRVELNRKTRLTEVVS